LFDRLVADAGIAAQDKDGKGLFTEEYVRDLLTNSEPLKRNLSKIAFINFTISFLLLLDIIGANIKYEIPYTQSYLSDLKGYREFLVALSAIITPFIISFFIQVEWIYAISKDITILIKPQLNNKNDLQSFYGLRYAPFNILRVYNSRSYKPPFISQRAGKVARWVFWFFGGFVLVPPLAYYAIQYASIYYTLSQPALSQVASLTIGILGLLIQTVGLAAYLFIKCVPFQWYDPPRA
jgi:hypothetical protein